MCILYENNYFWTYMYVRNGLNTPGYEIHWSLCLSGSYSICSVAYRAVGKIPGSDIKNYLAYQDIVRAKSLD